MPNALTTRIRPVHVPLPQPKARGCGHDGPVRGRVTLRDARSLRAWLRQRPADPRSNTDDVRLLRHVHVRSGSHADIRVDPAHAVLATVLQSGVFRLVEPVVPIVNILTLYVFAFSSWPALKK